MSIEGGRISLVPGGEFKGEFLGEQGWWVCLGVIIQGVST